MSLLAKARAYERGFPLFLIDPIIQYQEQGVDYIDALLNGYTNDNDPNWNEYFPGHKIAMSNPLSDGACRLRGRLAQDGSAIRQGCLRPS